MEGSAYILTSIDFSDQFDIWNLIKRPNTTEPYVLTTRYRTCKNPVRRTRASMGIRRRRRPDSRAESEGESNQSIATSEFDFDRDYFFQDEFDFDGTPFFIFIITFYYKLST